MNASSHTRAHALAIALAVVVLIILPASSAFAGSTALPLTLVSQATYTSPYGTFIDGVVRNDTSATVACPWVRVTWSPEHYDAAWPESAALSPGDWTTFHFSWPCDVPLTAVPTAIEPFAALGNDGRVRLEVSAVTGPVPYPETGKRIWTVTVTNTSTVPVSGISVSGYEDLYGSFHDALFDSCGADSLEPGASVQFTLYGKRPTYGAVNIGNLQAYGLERPSLTLNVSSVSPPSGSPITIRMELRRPDGSPATGGRWLKLYSSADGKDWYKEQMYYTESGVVYASILPVAATYYRATFWGDGVLGSAHSEPVLVSPAGGPMAPSVPASVRVRRRFAVCGTLRSGYPAPTQVVSLTAYRKVGRKWRVKARFTTLADEHGEYTANLALKQRGNWKIVASTPGVGSSGAAYLRVK